MSLIRCGKSAKEYEDDCALKPAYTLLKGYTYNVDNIMIKAYSRNLWGMAFYDKPWDNWRSDRVRTSIYIASAIPSYFRDRNIIFSNISEIQVDK